MQLILLASGMGSRLGYHTKYIPKCAVKIKNKSIVEYNFNFFNNFSKKIAVVGYKKI